jgi:hypothetical protein
MRKIAFAELPDRRSLLRQWHKVYGPRGTRRLTVAVINNDVLKLWTHYDRKINRVRPCEGYHECQYCQSGQTRRFMAYAAALTENTREICIVELTEGATRKLVHMNLIPDKLRGQVLTLYRVKPNKNAPVIVEAKPLAAHVALPDEVDPLPSLLRLWGWTDKHEQELRAREQETAMEVKELIDNMGHVELPTG